MKKIDWKLCMVADVEAAGGRFLPELVDEAVRAGVTMVQLRAKTLDSGDFLILAQKLVEILKPRQIPFIINDRLDIAQACDADGVHLGQRDIPLDLARRILGRKKLIGYSVSTVHEAQSAAGADYLGVGPVYFSESKQDLPKLLGTEGLKAIRKSVKNPILAIGGIDLGNISEVMAIGIDGVAVISAILSAPDITQAVHRLRNAIVPKL
ncbi:MAG: thiamine phosphate synthase [Candidatus Aminicenantes bacterium]|nr:thiamine phosphate synthase [Candidatus Aminicenantes bacterium]